MTAKLLSVALVLGDIGSYMLWSAYQIHYRGRTGLVRLGSKPMPGAGLLKAQFAAIHGLHGIAIFAAVGVILYTGKVALGIWLILAVSIALALCRIVLVRAIEIRANPAERE